MRLSELIKQLTALQHKDYDYRVVLEDSEFKCLHNVEKAVPLTEVEHPPYILIIQGSYIPIEEVS